MQWKIKQPPKISSRRVVARFAWVPLTSYDGLKRIFWTKYLSYEMYYGKLKFAGEHDFPKWHCMGRISFKDAAQKTDQELRTLIQFGTHWP